MLVLCRSCHFSELPAANARRARWLRAQGYRPGVVSRGYGGTARGCVEVQPHSLPAEVGDEPLLIRVKTGAPVVVGRDRVAAARTLLARHPGVDVIVSDDGLQHYRLQRDIELAVIDAASGLGNGWPLPAGPLREPKSRLASVDAVIQVVRGAAQPRAYPPVATWRADYRVGLAWRLRAPHDKRPLADLPPLERAAILLEVGEAHLHVGEAARASEAYRSALQLCAPGSMEADRTRLALAAAAGRG